MCGIIGVYNNEEASNLAYLGLYALQHRGQECAGIVSSDGKAFHQHREMGLVNDIFSEKVLSRLPGSGAIGHVRYTTSGESDIKNAYPFVMKYAHGWLAVAHNGNLTNYKTMRTKLEEDGAIFQATVDSEVVMNLVARGGKALLEERLPKALKQIKGSYSFVFLTETGMIAARDPKGFRPLVLGKLGNGYVVASETCALDIVGAEFVREVEPGEMIVFDKGEMKSSYPFGNSGKKAHCIFEYTYFARPDGVMFGRSVYEVRKGFGAQLAKEHPVNADVVIPVPDSGVPSAIGYSQESGIPFDMGLLRNHYLGKSFVEPKKGISDFGAKIRLSPLRDALKDKKVVLVDDSIVRGESIKKVVKMLKEAGTKEIHLRISSPPISWPCFYGINIPPREELIANKMDPDELKDLIGCDSIAYLSHDGMYRFAKASSKECFCDACFTGKYPEELDDYSEVYELSKR